LIFSDPILPLRREDREEKAKGKMMDNRAWADLPAFFALLAPLR
jgi:hypothetical protein